MQTLEYHAGRATTHGGKARDARAICVRAATAADRAGVEAMASRLSRETIYRRFHLPYPGVPGWMVSQLVRAGDPRTRNLLAVADGEIVGHAMFVVAEDAKEAEIALLVEDAWQSRGVGKLLLSELAYRARHHGVEAFTGEVLGENERPIRLMRSVLSGVTLRAEGGLYHTRAPLAAPAPADAADARQRCA